jgi:hypothetical protein
MITETIPCSGFRGLKPYPQFADVEEAIPKILETFDHELTAVEKYDLAKSLRKEKVVGAAAQALFQYGWRV